MRAGEGRKARRQAGGLRCSARAERRVQRHRAFHQARIANNSLQSHGGDNFGFPGSPNVEGDLIQAMLTNPHLQIEVESGLYDLATPFYGTERTMEHLGLPEKLQKNIHLQYYDAGHMMYLREEDLAKLKANVASFIDTASK
jgi:carboxypeptidase C (cathepsin A)